VVLAWLVFALFRRIKLDWVSGAVVALGDAVILAVFLAVQTDASESFTIVARAVEAPPNAARPGHDHSGKAEPTDQRWHASISNRSDTISIRILRRKIP
jgi:hypothetical protein